MGRGGSTFQFNFGKRTHFALSAKMQNLFWWSDGEEGLLGARLFSSIEQEHNQHFACGANEEFWSQARGSRSSLHLGLSTSTLKPMHKHTTGDFI